jgi:hypothetical protein
VFGVNRKNAFRILPIWKALLVHGDDCRLELYNFSHRYTKVLLPYSVLKPFRTYMSGITSFFLV